MTKVDVGGNAALSVQEYTAYGLRATTGMNRNEVEGIRVGGATGANDNYFSDFALLRGDRRQLRRPLRRDAGPGNDGASTSASPAAMRITAARTPTFRATRGRRRTSTAARSRGASPADQVSTCGR